MPTVSGFQHFDGPCPIRTASVVASQAFDDGDVLKLSNAGTADELTVIGVTDATTAVYGVFHSTPVAATDSDYASIKDGKEYIKVVKGTEQLWTANVETGSADQTTDVGYEADLASADGITLNASTYNIFTVTKVLNSTTVIGYFTT